MAKVQLVQKWGYMDERGRLAIPVQFNDAGYFSEGLAPVSLDGKFGFIDTAGHFAIAPKFDWAGEFESGLAPVTEGDSGAGSAQWIQGSLGTSEIILV